MSVKPGKGGQKFLEDTYDRVYRLRKEIERQNLDTIIQVDGGITDENIQKIYESGADSVAIGTYLAKESDDLPKLIEKVDHLNSIIKW